jgi:hypothetical protein
LDELKGKDAIYQEISSKKMILLMTKTRVFAIFGQIAIDLNRRNRIFQGRREAERKVETVETRHCLVSI